MVKSEMKYFILLLLLVCLVYSESFNDCSFCKFSVELLEKGIRERKDVIVSKCMDLCLKRETPTVCLLVGKFLNGTIDLMTSVAPEKWCALLCDTF